MDLSGRSLGIYRVGPELGRGGMGTVYRAEATEGGVAGPAGSAVALKVFHPELVEDARAFERFRREAEVGRRIRHENVVRTHEIGSAEVEGETFHFMVMEVIEGRTLKALLAELGTVPESLLLPIAEQALLALEAIHELGVIHRDIKPENIVITPDHRVLVMDLGVARLQEHGKALTQTGEFVGSLPYAAPEQFTAPDEVNARCDLYAFGIALYELATGKHPFDIADMSALLQQKLHTQVKPPRTLLPELDPFWDAVIETCVRRDPSERFASAAELRRVLQEGEAGGWWRERIAGRARPSAERALKRLRLPRDAPLVGRAGELRRLRELHAGAARSGGVLLLSGPTGAGKSRLLYEFLEEQAHAGGPQVAAGVCVGSGGRSYQPFIEALGDLLGVEAMERGQRPALLRERLASLLPDMPGVVAHLSDWLLGAAQPGMEESFSKDALLSSFAETLRRLAAERPVLLAIEDLHLAGVETLELFSYLARCVEGHAIVLIAVYPDDEVDEGSPLHELVARAGAEGRMRTLALPPLTAAATEDLVRAIARNPRTVLSLARPLHGRSEGNPFLMLEMIAHLRENGRLVVEGEGLEMRGSLDEAAVPSTVRDLVGLKLGRLEEEQRESMEAAAVLGFEFDPALLAQVLDEKKIKLFQRLATLERKHRLVKSAGNSAFRFASRQLYEAIYDGINPGLRGEYHSLVADTIQESLADDEREPEGGEAYALLRHLHLSERTLEADPFLDRALDHMAGNLHPNDAAPLLEKVAPEFAEAAPRKRFDIAMRLWGFYELLGARAAQLRVLEGAKEVADRLGERGAQARVHACLGATAFYTGDYARAQAEVEIALPLAREAGDRKWESTSLHALGSVAWRRGDLRTAARHWKEALKLRTEIEDRRGQASTLMVLAAVLPAIGEGDEATSYREQALAICRDIGERRIEAALLNGLGNQRVDTQRFEEASDCFSRGARICSEIGDQATEATVLSNFGRLHRLLGRDDEALRCWERVLTLYVGIHNRDGEIWTRLALSGLLAKHGEFAQAQAHAVAALDLAQQGGQRLQVGEAKRALGRLHHHAGRRAEAWEALRGALELQTQTGSADSMHHTYDAMGLCALAEDDPVRATEYFSHALTALASVRTASGDRVLVEARLARSLNAAGRSAEARTIATRLSDTVAAGQSLIPENAPEIHFRLWEVLGGTECGRAHLAAARTALGERARAITNAGHREHFVTRSGPNPEILAVAKRVLDAGS